MILGGQAILAQERHQLLTVPAHPACAPGDPDGPVQDRRQAPSHTRLAKRDPAHEDLACEAMHATTVEEYLAGPLPAEVLIHSGGAARLVVRKAVMVTLVVAALMVRPLEELECEDDAICAAEAAPT